MVYNSPTGLIVTSVVFEILAIAAVRLRFLSRQKAKAGYWFDDWFIIAGLICGTILAVDQIVGVAVKALGVPMLSLRETDPEAYNARMSATRRIEFTWWLVGIVALSCVKLSIAFFYRRIFGKHRIYGPMTTVWIIIIALWGAAFFVEILLECETHLHVMWDGPSALRKKYCSHSNKGGYALLLSGPITDIIMFLLPLPWVARLNTSLRQKLQIMSVFAIGIFPVIASTVKAAMWIEAEVGNVNGALDVELVNTAISLWNFLEVMVGILVACAMTIKPLIASWKFGENGSNIISRQFRSLRSSAASSTISKEKLDSMTSPRISTFDKGEAIIAVRSDSASDLESNSIDTTDLPNDDIVASNKSQDLGHIAVEKSYSVQYQQESRNVTDHELGSGVPAHIAPFYYRSTTPHGRSTGA